MVMDILDLAHARPDLKAKYYEVCKLLSKVRQGQEDASSCKVLVRLERAAAHRAAADIVEAHDERNDR